MSFYNTINASGEELENYLVTAHTQDNMVLAVYKHQNNALAWFQVKEVLPSICEVSIKRSISNLKNKGFLRKTTEKIKGLYGKPCYKYQLIC